METIKWFESGNLASLIQIMTIIGQPVVHIQRILQVNEDLGNPIIVKPTPLSASVKPHYRTERGVFSAADRIVKASNGLVNKSDMTGNWVERANTTRKLLVEYGWSITPATIHLTADQYTPVSQDRKEPPGSSKSTKVSKSPETTLSGLSNKGVHGIPFITKSHLYLRSLGYDMDLPKSERDAKLKTVIATIQSNMNEERKTHTWIGKVVDSALDRYLRYDDVVKNERPIQWLHHYINWKLAGILPPEQHSLDMDHNQSGHQLKLF